MPPAKEDARIRLQRGGRRAFMASRVSSGRPPPRSPPGRESTERTFFRYFPDKREVLFDGQGCPLGEP